MSDEFKKKHNGTSLPRDSQTIRGAKLADVEELRTVLLRDNNGINRPYLKFADLPIPIVDGQSAHMLCIGSSGGGKTTTLRTLMSYVMPLPLGRVQEISASAPHQRKPSSPQQLSRSLTFQAVVYNAKVEGVPFLAGLGFDTSTDLFILDPIDNRCFAWDLAKDVNSHHEIAHFVSLLIPTRAESGREVASSGYFEAAARFLIEDVIVSLRNAALEQGLQPAWTLCDILKFIERPNDLHYVLRWHDTPAEATARISSWPPSNLDGVLATARVLINPFREAAERWATAARLGRKISFKDWVVRGKNTVLVLPDTESNLDVNGPLIRVMLGALTELVLNREHSIVYDQSGHRHVRRRYFWFDELGDTGKLPTLKRLLAEGREFGVNAVLGLHAISHLEHTYGKEDANTILALCPFKAFLRAGDTATAEWMVRFVGDCLRIYRTRTFSTGTTRGSSWNAEPSSTVGPCGGTAVPHGPSTSSKQESRSATRTEGQSESVAQSHQDSEGRHMGTSQGRSSSTSTSHSDSVDLRQETAIYGSAFMNFPDPAKTRIIRVIAHVPSLGTWQADMSLNLMLEQLEKPVESVPKFQKWQDDHRVSQAKAWTSDDFCRLGIPILAYSAPAGQKELPTPNTRRIDDHNGQAEHNECDEEGGVLPPEEGF